MKTIFAATAIASLAIAAPASAETLMVIGTFPAASAAAPQAPVSLDQRIADAVDKACERPFVRDLKGQQLYKACRIEVRSEIESKLARSEGPVSIALR